MSQTRRQPERIDCPNGCGGRYMVGAGLHSHLRGGRCVGRAQERVLLPNNRRHNRETLPNLLYMAAVQGNQPVRGDDDFSIIDADLETFSLPPDVVINDCNMSKEDGRYPVAVDFVRDIISRRDAVVKTNYRTIAWKIGQVFYHIFFHLLRLAIIIVLGLIIYSFHFVHSDNHYCQYNNGEICVGTNLMELRNCINSRVVNS